MKTAMIIGKISLQMYIIVNHKANRKHSCFWANETK
jgi:hypothetical protein